MEIYNKKKNKKNRIVEILTRKNLSNRILFLKYTCRQSLDFAHDQLNIAEEMDSPNLRAEAYLNLAKAHERIGNLDTALSYARHSLYNECDHCKTAGLVQITVGSVHLELATFCKALQAFQQAHSIAQRIQDRTLEMQVNLNYYYYLFILLVHRVYFCFRKKKKKQICLSAFIRLLFNLVVFYVDFIVCGLTS